MSRVDLLVDDELSRHHGYLQVDLTKLAKQLLYIALEALAGVRVHKVPHGLQLIESGYLARQLPCYRRVDREGVDSADELQNVNH